jgi:hypothetical protein
MSTPNLFMPFETLQNNYRFYISRYVAFNSSIKVYANTSRSGTPQISLVDRSFSS